MCNRIAFGLITALTIASLVTSCSGIPAGPPAKASAPKVPHIAVIPPAMTSPFHVAVRDGTVAADDGEVIRLDGLIGFSEEHHAKW